jgi:integrase/recombinase XerD
MYLKRDELKLLLSHIPDKDKLMVLVAFWHGLRASETVSLTPSNVSHGYLTVQRLKGSLKTSQPLIPSKDADLDYIPGLLKLVAETKKGERLFPLSRIQFYRIMVKAGEAAGLPKGKCHPHTLKHSIAMQTKASGLENVRIWLGHKSLASTGQYLKPTDDEAAAGVREAMGA